MERKLSKMEHKLSGSTVSSSMVPTREDSSQTQSISQPPPVAMQEGLTGQYTMSLGVDSISLTNGKSDCTVSLFYTLNYK
jgi:hypothetical protein